MRPNFEQLSFANAYYLANEVRTVIVEWPDNDHSNVEEFFDFADQEVLECLAKPHRWSLLHLISEAFHDDGFFEFDVSAHHYLDLIVEGYQTILENHGIAMPSVEIPDEDAIDGEKPRQLRDL